MDITEVQPAARPALYRDQRLKLGLFGFSASGGMVMMRDAPLRIAWDEMTSIARKADALGMEVIIPVARWRGYGGTTDYNGTSYEPFTWAAGLSAVTRDIMVLSTVHVPLVHPVMAAKMATTIDHISSGRFGMNVVMGWFDAEMGMFGVTQQEHDRRYAYGHEWLEIVDRLWAGETPFDYHGEFFSLTDVRGSPLPIQRRPVILNAGTSPAAMDFAARSVDFIFGVPPTLDAARRLVADTGARAAQHGREVQVLTCAMIICRDTQAEAEAAYEHVLEHGDWDGAAEAMTALNLSALSVQEALRDFQSRFVVGFGTQVIVGTPDHVAAELQAIADAGVAGVLLGFVDYEAEIDAFGATVLPLLREAGLRH